MKRDNTEESDLETQGIEPHRAARPMKVVVDEKGCYWLCDMNVDENRDLAPQGCWRCSDMAFTRNN